mmetsp:Transcript_21588/g.42399  ORF Transcript_21588/g.42399 Transcript_21588/m.42399 type:complete len:653 (+) Transcript_21588:144-2102(+)
MEAHNCSGDQEQTYDVGGKPVQEEELVETFDEDYDAASTALKKEINHHAYFKNRGCSAEISNTESSLFAPATAKNVKQPCTPLGKEKQRSASDEEIFMNEEESKMSDSERSLALGLEDENLSVSGIQDEVPADEDCDDCPDLVSSINGIIFVNAHDLETEANALDEDPNDHDLPEQYESTTAESPIVPRLEIDRLEREDDCVSVADTDSDSTPPSPKEKLISACHRMPPLPPTQNSSRTTQHRTAPPPPPPPHTQKLPANRRAPPPPPPRKGRRLSHTRAPPPIPSKRAAPPPPPALSKSDATVQPSPRTASEIKRPAPPPPQSNVQSEISTVEKDHEAGTLLPSPRESIEVCEERSQARTSQDTRSIRSRSMSCASEASISSSSSAVSRVSSGSARRDEEEINAEAMDRLADVSRRRTQRQTTRRGINDRVRAALATNDADLIVFRLFAEIADAILAKLHVVLADSPTWHLITQKEGYTPGAVTTGSVDEQEQWMDLFVQLACGWPSSSVAFGPVNLNSSHAIAQLYNEDESEDTENDPNLDHEYIGTLTFKNSEDAEDSLPPGPITDAILHFHSQVSVLVERKGSLNPMQVLRFASTVAAAMDNIERIPVGEGGTPKRPTEFQMQFLQRLNHAALEALLQFEEGMSELLH